MSASSTTESSSAPRLRSAAQVVPEGQSARQVKCKLCSGSVPVDNTFRPATIECPHCSVKFYYDPLKSPLPIRGVKLRYADVAAAQSKPGRAPTYRAPSQPFTPPYREPESPLARVRWIGLAFAVGILFCRYLLKSFVRM